MNFYKPARELANRIIGRKSSDLSKPFRVRFVGDHSKYHCGSAAVAGYIRHKLGEQCTVVEDGDDFDALVVNGEGSMHHDGPDCIRKMQEIERSVERGRKTYLVNTLWQSNSDRFDHVLKQIDQIIVRETLSQAELRDRHGVDAQVIPDFSYFAPIKKANLHSAPKGKILITDFYSSDLMAFVTPSGGPLTKNPFIDMKKTSWSNIVSTLKQNILLVTGRHHAMYAACKAEIPFVVTAGNSHKIQGLFESAGVAIPTITRLRDVDATIDWAMRNRSAYDDLFAWMRSQTEWSFAPSS